MAQEHLLYPERTDPSHAMLKNEEAVHEKEILRMYICRIRCSLYCDDTCCWHTQSPCRDTWYLAGPPRVAALWPPSFLAWYRRWTQGPLSLSNPSTKSRILEKIDHDRYVFGHIPCTPSLPREGCISWRKTIRRGNAARCCRWSHWRHKG